ncbi:hypothetical protein Tco_0985107 [Tanacetum coccineum]
MNPIATQQAALDNALVTLEKRLKIKRCNARIAFSKPKRKETYQVTLEALKLSPCYLAFLITAEVLEIYMHQFWNTIKKIRNTNAYTFKLDKKKCRVDTKVFCEILQIRLIFPNQEFVELPSKEYLVSFTKELGLDRLRESRAQILWGVYKLKNVDYVDLLWEDFMYQPDNREISSARKEHMPSEPVNKAKRVKRPAKKSTTTSTAGVVIRDTTVKEARKEKPNWKLHKVQARCQDDERNDDYDNNDSDNKDGKSKDDDGNSYHEDCECLKQSSSVSSDFASKFLIMENVPPAIDEVASMMTVKSHQEESSTQAPFLFTVPEMAIPETATAQATTVPPTISMITPLPQLTTPISYTSNRSQLQPQIPASSIIFLPCLDSTLFHKV